MNIRNKRLSLNLTQDDLAQKLCVQRTTISMWENGEAMPRADKLPELARILQCEISDLFEDETA